MAEGMLSKIFSREGAKTLQGADNWVLQGLGGLLGAGYGAYDYDYPDTIQGWGGLLGNVGNAAAKGLENTINEAATDATMQVAGASDGKNVTDLTLGLLGTNALVPFRAPRGSLPAHVWQGSPHKYGPEGARESLKHIGKGEGAQAYGWGRYDAGARSVGENYKRQLSPGDVLMRKDGTVIMPSRSGGNGPDDVFASFASGYGDLDEAAKSLRQQIEMLDDGTSIYHSMRLDPGAITPDELRKSYADALDWYDANKADLMIDRNHGYLYKHDLPDEDIARYLDWDAPLSEQPEDVLRQIESNPELSNLLSEVEYDKRIKATRLDDEATGADFYHALSDAIVRGDVYPNAPGDVDLKRLSSEALARAGIPGLKYYDGMSRGKGEGTRNYVTWDQDVLNRMKLLERNGEPMGLLDKPSESVTLGANRGGKSSGLLGLSAAGGESGATNAGGLLDLDAMRDLEKRVYNLSDVNDFIEIGKQTGNKVSVPFQVGGPKMTVDEIEALEAAHKFSPAKEGYFEPKIFTPEDFEIGSLIIPNPGDPTAAGRLIQSASGPSNVVNVSGTDFMRQIGDGEGNPAIWASGPSVMTKLQNRGLLADGNPAYFVSSEQGAESVLFNTVAAERYEELFDPSKISKKGATEIRKALERRTKDKEGNLAPIAKWQENIPDPSSPKFAKWLHSLPGTTKSEVIQRLNKDKIISEGAPDVREIIHSVTAPENVWALDKDAAWAKNLANDVVPGLLYDPLVGKSIAKVDPGVPLRPSPNPSFPTETTGEYVGGFGFRPTRSQVWRDWYEGKNLANKPVNAAHRGFTLSYPVQRVDAEWQDTLMKLREEAMRQK